MKILLVCVGKIKESYINTGVHDYVKRLKHYVPLELLEIKDEPIRKKDNLGDLLKKESERILRSWREDYFYVVLDRTGKQLSSEELSEKFNILLNSDCKGVAFVIGGALGLDEEIKNKADMILSLSEFTLPHQLTRLVVLEQIYRAFTILRGESYHK